MWVVGGCGLHTEATSGIRFFFCFLSRPFPLKRDHLRMNVAPDQTIILGLQIVLDHSSLSLIDQ